MFKQNWFSQWVVLPTLLLVSFASVSLEITVKGISNGDIVDNVRLFVRQESLPVSEFEIDEYQLKVIKKVDKAVQAFGYYNASINIEPITYLPEGNFTIELNIKLNKITMVSRVILQTDYSSMDAAQKQNVPAKLVEVIEQIRAMQSKPLNHNQYESLKSQLSTFALLYGYFDFKFLLHKLLILPSQTDSGNEATVHWLFNLGERYRFGDVEFLQETRGQAIATSVKTFKTGDFFDQSKIGQYSIDLASTGYYDNAIARANASKAVDKKVPVELILKPKPKDLFQFGVGFSTDTRARASLDWERPWVNLDGHSIGANLYVSDPRKSLSFDYRIPKANPLNDFLNYRVSLKRTNENQTQSDNVSFEVLRQWGATQEQAWDKIGFIKLEQESFIQGFQEKQTTRLLMPGFTYSRTRKDGDIFVNWGDRQQLTIQAGSKSLLSDIDFLKVLARTKWIRQFDKHRVTFRADAGAIYTNDFSRVPSTQRFFAGGDQSIRGFGFNEVSAVGDELIDGELELVGGKYLSVVSLEYAYNVSPKWRAAVFVDAGNANDTFASDIATGVGIGAHWLSPIGNVQLYVARGEASFGSGWQFHVIIGPGL